MANLLHIKGSRTQVLNSFPTKRFGKDEFHKALIEIPKDKFIEYKSNKNKIVKTLASYGYSEVELDNNGFRSGSLNLKAGIKK